MVPKGSEAKAEERPDGDAGGFGNFATSRYDQSVGECDIRVLIPLKSKSDLVDARQINAGEISKPECVVD